MTMLRIGFIGACLVCFAVVAFNARWEARLRQYNRTWIVNLSRAPIWAAPEVPAYPSFQNVFEDVSPEGDPGITISRSVTLGFMAVDLLLYIWPTTLGAGLMYVWLRGNNRDPVLHCGLCVGFGITIAAMICFGLWLVFGGWGPPSPEVFGSLGICGGFLVGVATFRRAPLQI